MTDGCESVRRLSLKTLKKRRTEANEVWRERSLKRHQEFQVNSTPLRALCQRNKNGSAENKSDGPSQPISRCRNEMNWDQSIEGDSILASVELRAHDECGSESNSPEIFTENSPVFRTKNNGEHSSSEGCTYSGEVHSKSVNSSCKRENSPDTASRGSPVFSSKFQASTTRDSPGELGTRDTHGKPTSSNGTPCISQRKMDDEGYDAGLQSNSIVEKLKKILEDNAFNQDFCAASLTPRGLEVMKTAYSQASDIKNYVSEYDIGPFYGLPGRVKDLLRIHHDIEKLYDWQNECLSLDAVKNHTNLIYSLPTSGGKTLVAEIIIMRELLCFKRNAMLVLPYVSIVQEKVKTMSPFALELDFLIEEYSGSKGVFPPRKHRKWRTLYIATIEKAQSIINSLIEAQRLEELGLVVVDEIHMIGDGGRGANMESMITKLRYFSPTDIMIVGMSATLGNIQEVKTFLDADIFSMNFRPIELKEYVKINNDIFEINTHARSEEDVFKFSRTCNFSYTPEMKKIDPDMVFGLVREVIPKSSCLVFCPTKQNCENVAKMICSFMPKEVIEEKFQEKVDLYKILKNEGNGKICSVLKYTLPYGIAYHHSGLTADERRILEEAYMSGTLCCLTCTSTLAAGVNLPAERVILRAPYIAQQFISQNRYRQMIGRAGRTGLGQSGESIVICKVGDQNKLAQVIQAPTESCNSCLLEDDKKGLRLLMLSTIGLQIVKSKSDATNLLLKTLLAIQCCSLNLNIPTVVDDALHTLHSNGLLSYRSEDLTDTGAVSSKLNDDQDVFVGLQVSRLGRATYKGGIDVDLAKRLYADLNQAQSSLAVNSHLHLLYLVTPYEMMDQIKVNSQMYYKAYVRLSDEDLGIANLIGIPEASLVKIACGQRDLNEVVRRFYVTLVLYEIWRQQTIWDVSAKYQLPRGNVQNLIVSATSFASCVLRFCQEMDEFWAYQSLLDNLVKKLSNCVVMELMPLMEIPAVKRGRAWQLYNAGYKTPQQVARADPKDLVKQIQHMSSRVARQIIDASKLLLIQKVEALREEAEMIIGIDF